MTKRMSMASKFQSPSGHENVCSLKGKVFFNEEAQQSLINATLTNGKPSK